MIQWHSFATPMGRMYAALKGSSLRRLTWHVSNAEEFAADLRNRFPGSRLIQAEPAAREVERQISDYFAGQRSDFDIELDLRGLTDFERDVLIEARRIPLGTTTTYSELARRIGRPGSARAVGNALRRNPIPIIIPCHRIVRADGQPGGYGGPAGTGEKLALLELEARISRK